MKQYRFKSLVIMSLAAISLFAANDKKSILSIKESITDNDIVFPASFETDTKAMMENWYLQNYAILDKEVENKSTGEVDEAEYIRRLKAIPSSAWMGRRNIPALPWSVRPPRMGRSILAPSVGAMRRGRRSTPCRRR